MLLLSNDLWVLTASASYLEAFKVPRTDVEGHGVFEADARRWNLPAVRTFLERVRAGSSPEVALSLTVMTPATGVRLHLSARKSASDGVAAPVVLLVIELEPRLAGAPIPPDEAHPDR